MIYRYFYCHCAVPGCPQTSFLQLDWYPKWLTVAQTWFARKENQSSVCLILFCFFVIVAQIKCDGALNSAVTEQTAMPESGIICSMYMGHSYSSCTPCSLHFLALSPLNFLCNWSLHCLTCQRWEKISVYVIKSDRGSACWEQRWPWPLSAP